MAGNDNDCLVFVRTRTDHGIRTVKFKIEWTIQDFILLKDVTKPLTSSPVLCRDLGIDVPGGCWYLTLTPMRKMVLEGESTDCVSLFVARTAQRSAKWPAIHLKGSIGYGHIPTHPHLHIVISNYSSSLFQRAFGIIHLCSSRSLV